MATPVDADDSLSINISGIPAGATLNHGTLNGNGSYTLTPAQLAGLQLQASEGSGTLHVVVTSSEGSSTATSSGEPVWMSGPCEWSKPTPAARMLPCRRCAPRRPR